MQKTLHNKQNFFRIKWNAIFTLKMHPLKEVEIVYWLIPVNY